MRNEDYIKLKGFKNCYCDGIACAIGEFVDVYSSFDEQELLDRLSGEELQLLIDYAVLKNKIAGSVRPPYAKFVCKQPCRRAFNITC